MLHAVTKRLLSTTRIQQDIPNLTRRLFKLPGRPNPPSQHHNDLPSFLAHAHRTNLPATTPVYQGTHYEYTVQQTLRRLAFNLHRVGGRDDAGVDLVGTWHVPGREHPLRVFVQCKALSRKAGPNIVRELEGCFRSRSRSWSSVQTGVVGVVGVLVSSREATKGVRDALARSRVPVVWMMVRRDGVVQQVLWNREVEVLGVARLQAVVRYLPGRDGEGEADREIALAWDGEEVPDMDRVEADLEALKMQWLALWDLPLVDGKLEALLDIVGGLFPDEKPLFTTSGETGTCSTLSEAERDKILQAVRHRLR